MHLGLESLLPYVLYAGGIAAFLLSVFRRPIWGLYYLIPLMPLQTLRYQMNVFPLGESVIGIILLGVVLGLLRRGEAVFPRTPWTGILGVYILFTFVSLCFGSFTQDFPLPLPGDARFDDWQSYIMMPLLLFLAAASVKDRRDLGWMVLLICLSGFALDKAFWDIVGHRDYSAFSNDLRETGPMGYAGANGLAAFLAQFGTFALVLAGFKGRLWYRAGFALLALFSAVCLMYSLSRGGYIALLIGWLFVGAVKQRKVLLAMVVFFLVWESVVPNAVQTRVFMTYDGSGDLDHSSETRINLWEEAIQSFSSSPILGRGFDTYAYTSHYSHYQDSHNYYLKVLVETGLVGMFLFLALLWKMFRTGYRLFRTARDPLLASVGLGLAAWTVTAATANFFGDRWSYMQVNGYMWLLAGLVARGLMLEQGAAPADTPEEIATQQAEVVNAI